jgi:hypothetical protein
MNTPQNGHRFPGFQDHEEGEDLSLTDELDHEILMHRDAHFGGDFQVMLDYYAEDRIGVFPDFDLERIQYLAHVEAELGEDLAALMLTGPEAERVGKARVAYTQFKEIYSHGGESIAKLLADLILSEDPEPISEMEAIVEKGPESVPALLRIIKSEDAYDALFPGYGFAPYLAAICLGQIKDPRAVAPLFEMLSREALFEEDVVLDALFEIGESAKSFLLQILKSRPITRDNIHAAYALTIFSTDQDVAIACFEQLQDHEVRQKPLLRSYLICNCDALQYTALRSEFADMVLDQELPLELRTEIESIVHNWH